MTEKTIQKTASESHTDQRVIHTRIAIRDAFVYLIAERGFEALSVTDITQQAEINRSTFYLHYRDKFDLLEQTELEVIRDIENIILRANSLDLTDFSSAEQPIPVAVSVFEYLEQNATLIKAIVGRNGGADFRQKLRKAVERNLKVGFMGGIHEDSFRVPCEYLIAYVTSAHFGLVQAWLEGGCVDTPKEMAVILSRLSWDGPLRAMGFCVPE